MPAKLSPGTPSMSAGTMTPCQWIEVGTVRWLVTRTVMVSPSGQTSSGPGTWPFTATAVRRVPVKLTSTDLTSRSYSVLGFGTPGLREDALVSAQPVAIPPEEASAAVASAPDRPRTKRLRVMLEGTGATAG